MSALFFLNVVPLRDQFFTVFLCLNNITFVQSVILPILNTLEHSVPSDWLDVELDERFVFFHTAV